MTHQAFQRVTDKVLLVVLLLVYHMALGLRSDLIVRSDKP